MKELRKVLLINWHSFSKELIEVGSINFLTGKNAVGKSTIVDAIQLVILGDTRGTSFNKAASEKAGRSLISYLKGEIGGDENGNKKYLRDGEFSSYVALEFYDTNNNVPFVIGLQFDISGDKLTPHQFIYDGIIPEQCFVANNRPMNFKAFKDYVTISYKNVMIPESLATYKEEMKKKLGSLSNRFFALFKKAVPFQPIYDISKFITEYICDVKYDIKKDLEKMQENVRNYTSLEEEAKVIQSKIFYLERINELYAAYNVDKTKIDQVNYLVAKLEIAKKKKDIVALNETLKTLSERYDEIARDQEMLSNDITSWNKVRDELIIEKENNDSQAKHQAYTGQKESVNREIDRIEETFTGSCTRLVNSFNEFVSKAKAIKDYKFDTNLLADTDIDIDRIYAICDQIIEKGEHLSHLSAQNLNNYKEDDVLDLVSTIESLEEIFNKIRVFLQTANDTYIQRKGQFINAIDNLKRGKKQYPSYLVEFKAFMEDALYNKFNTKIELNFVADLMEIRDKRWQSALETFLSGPKFSFVIDEKYYHAAIEIYDANRNRFQDISILDTGKIMSKGPFKVLDGSLAEEIETKNKYVRNYIDFLIGNLMKVYDLKDINKYDRGITSTGMLYQQFVTRQMNMDRYKTPYIGAKASETQIEGYQEEISILNEKIAACQAQAQTFYTVCRFTNLSVVDVHYHFGNLQQVYRIDDLNAQVQEINARIESIDMTDVVAIQGKIDEVDNEIRFANNQRHDSDIEKGSILAKIEDIKSNKLVDAQRSLQAKEDDLSTRYTQEWILENINEDMMGMLSYITDDQISKKLAESRRLADNLSYKKRNLDKARQDYVRTFQVSIDTSSESNDKFEEELNKYRDIQLPKYIDMIGKAKAKTYEEFRQDLLAKLKSSIETVVEQIDTLNVSLGNFQFGRDRYEFKTRPNQDFIDIYNMIMDDLLMQDSRSNSQAFYDKYQDTIDTFFKAITEAPGANDQERREIVDKNIAKYTDYRTYLNFDLLVYNQETNTVQSLANSMGTKSGGETQTPFYISILASIASEYRIGLEDDSSNTPRLILFDEAFNKMDAERIRESIELLKRFHLQAILVAPPEKVSDIAPLVDRNLCVIRRRNSAFVKVFDKQDIESISE